MGSLKKKLAFSYGLLIVIIFAVSAWGIYHLVSLGRAIDVILVNNYKSIRAAENMKDALERLDSAALFLIAGHADKSRRQFVEYSERFSQEFETASSNITEAGEDEIIADIGSKYSSYRQEVEQFLDPPRQVTAAEQTRLYFERLEPGFLALKQRLDDLLALNQEAMLGANEEALSQSFRAEVSMAGMAALALLTALAFAWRFTSYVVDPITTLTEKAKLIGEGELDQHIDIQSQDEIGVLAAEFNRMAARLRDLRKSDYWRLLIEQKKSDAVIDSIYEPVIVTDARGRVTKINRSGQQLFGTPDQRMGADGDLSLSGSAAGEQIMLAVKDAVSMQRPVAAEGEAALVPIKAGGAERSFRLRTTPMRDSEGRLLGAVTVLEDVTALTELDRLKTEFISIASGRLREPLNSLMLAMHALIEGYTGELDEKQMDMLLDARRNAEQLDDIMNDLMELTEIETGARKMSKERLRPADLARSAVERFQSYAESRHVKLVSNVWPDLPWVFADRQAVKRIFDNLLSNAIRHTGRDGQVTIEAIERADRIFFSVRDTGEGIPEEYLPNIFSRFSRVGGQTGGGTGLGLALVKRLVEAQGGQVRVESKLGEGTVFTFTLLPGGPAPVRATARSL
ncbi:MAG TPA: ATP-binding protein [Blastocatellia bacterium]|nr:ATP-binding protein [Blastocatellia bacterium]